MHQARKYLRFFCLVTFAFTVSALAEPPVLFLVRHAERADTGGTPQKDPGLSEKGRERAEALAHELRDAGITALYTTAFKRTQQTAAPLAHSLGVESEVVPAKETSALLRKLKDGSGNALIVGHSNTLPEIMQALGISSPPKIGEADYDDLFVLIAGPPARLIHLHYR